MLVHVDRQFSFALRVYKDKPVKLALARRGGEGGRGGGEGRGWERGRGRGRGRRHGFLWDTRERNRLAIQNTS